MEPELYTENQINILHEIGDYFVNCSHSEGIGLGLLQASQSNIVISIDKGGHSSYIHDYLKVKTIECFIDFKCDFLTSEECEMYYSDYKRYMKWFDFDQNDMENALIQAYNNNYRFISNNSNINAINNSIKYKFIDLFKRNNIILLQQYYVPNNSIRADEINTTLQLNLNNRFIDKVILLNEENYDFSNFNNNHKIEQIVIHNRLTFKASFDYKQYLNSSDIVLLSNNDIEFTEDINNLKEYYFNNSVYCLTRYDDGDYKKANTGQYMYSQDAWIFKCDLNIDTSNIDYYYGLQYCDNALIYELNRQEIDTFNIPKNIKIIHHHDSLWRHGSEIKSCDLHKYNIQVVEKTTLPLYPIDAKNISHLLFLKCKYKLNSLNMNYFMKIFEILNAEKYEFEIYIQKILFKYEKTNSDINFITTTTRIVLNSPEIKDKQFFINFINEFYYYKNLSTNISSYKDVVWFVFDVFFYIFVSKKHRNEINDSDIFYKNNQNKDVDNIVNVLKNTLFYYDNNNHFFSLEYQNMFHCLDKIRKLLNNEPITYENRIIQNNSTCKINNAYLLCHGGLGDLIFMNGAIHFISLFYNKIYLFCSDTAKTNLQIMLAGINIEFITYDKWYGENVNKIGWPNVSEDWYKTSASYLYPIYNFKTSFDSEKYTSFYPDLSHINNSADALHHWENYGKDEGRQFCIAEEYFFDWQTYIQTYPDLSSIHNKKDALHHWNNYGKHENRHYFKIDVDLNSDFLVSAETFHKRLHHWVSQETITKYKVASFNNKITNEKFLRYEQNTKWETPYYYLIPHFYDSINLNMSIYYDYFHIPSTPQSWALYKKIKDYKIVFLHFVSSCGETHIPDNEWPHIYNEEYLIINPDKNHYTLTDSPIKHDLVNQYLQLLSVDYIDVILHASDIYVCDSSFASMIFPLRIKQLLKADNFIIYDRYYPGTPANIPVPVNLSRNK
jgi:hypothetical protein